MNNWRFINIIILIFIFERLFSILIKFPLSLFPFFSIIFFIINKKYFDNIILIILPSIFFDLFSGFHFGVFSLIIFVLSLFIYYFKKYFSFGKRSIIPDLIWYAFGIVILYALYSFFVSPTEIIKLMPVIFANALIAFVIFYYLIDRYIPSYA